MYWVDVNSDRSPPLSRVQRLESYFKNRCHIALPGTLTGKHTDNLVEAGLEPFGVFMLLFHIFTTSMTEIDGEDKLQQLLIFSSHTDDMLRTFC